MKTDPLIELLAKFEAAGVAATYNPIVQHHGFADMASSGIIYEREVRDPTNFAELFENEIASSGELRLVKMHPPIMIYTFVDDTTAQECAALIEPGSNRLVHNVNGETKVVKLLFDDGGLTRWWHEGPFLLYSSHPEIVAQIVTVLGKPLWEPPTGLVALRVSNESDTTWQNVTFAWNGESLVYGQLVPGIGGYRALPPKQPIKLMLDANKQTLGTEIRPLAAGSYVVDLTVQNGTLFARTFRDKEFTVATDLSGIMWTWKRAEYADGSTYIPPTFSSNFAPHLRFGTTETYESDGFGNAFKGNLGCNRMWGDFYVNSEKEIWVTSISSTHKGGSSSAVESETRGFALYRAAYRYDMHGDELHLITLAGDRMILSSN